MDDTAQRAWQGSAHIIEAKVCNSSLRHLFAIDPCSIRRVVCHSGAAPLHVDGDVETTDESVIYRDAIVCDIAAELRWSLVLAQLEARGLRVPIVCRDRQLQGKRHGESATASRCERVHAAKNGNGRAPTTRTSNGILVASYGALPPGGRPAL